MLKTATEKSYAKHIVAASPIFTIKWLKGAIEGFEKILKSLNDFIQQKRDKFPRFYFLSSEEIIEILSDSNPVTVQPFMKKCFEGIDKLEFNDNCSEVRYLISAQGERFLLNSKQNGMVIRDAAQVEVWLGDLEKAMKKQVQKLIRAFYTMIQSEKVEMEKRKDWILEPFSQVSITVDSIMWTTITEAYLLADEDEGDMTEWHQTNVTQIQELITKIRGKLDKVSRKTLVALITQDVHYRDIIKELYIAQC